MSIDFLRFNSPAELSAGTTWKQLSYELRRRGIPHDNGSSKDVLVKLLWPVIRKEKLDALPASAVSSLG